MVGSANSYFFRFGVLINMIIIIKQQKSTATGIARDAQSTRGHHIQKDKKETFNVTTCI